jgi:PhnB protein
MAAVKPIPEGYPQVTPYLVVDGAGAAIDFYGKVFGTTERMRLPGPDGTIGHAELQLGESLIMVADEAPQLGLRGPRAIGGTPVTISVYVEDVDGVVERAVQAGARVLRRGPVLRGPVGAARGPVRAPVERRHPCRGRVARRDGPAGGRAGRRLTAPAAVSRGACRPGP